MSVFPPDGNGLALRGASSRAQLTTDALKIAAVASHQHPRKSLWREGGIYVQPRELRGIHVHCNEILSSLVLTSFPFILHPCPILSLILGHTFPPPSVLSLAHISKSPVSFLCILVYHCTFPPFLSCCPLFYPSSCHIPPPPLFGARRPVRSDPQQTLNCVLTHFMFTSS